MRIAILVSKGQRNKGYSIPAHVVGVGFETEVVETRLPVFPYTQLDRTLMEVSTIDGALRAADRGFDAVFINTVGDYGLEALRSALRVPVVGAGQATMLTAASLGKRFSIVTIWPPSLRYLYEDLLLTYGLTGYCAAIHHTSSDAQLASLQDDENFVTKMRRGEKNTLNRIIDLCKKTMEQDRADTIMLGCTCMAPIADRVAASCEAPVLNPLTTGYKFTEMLLSLGLAQSRLAYRPSSVTPLAVFPAMTTAIASQMGETTCPVCELASSGDE
jgi:allantoin racemase